MKRTLCLLSVLLLASWLSAAALGAGGLPRPDAPPGSSPRATQPASAPASAPATNPGGQPLDEKTRLRALDLIKQLGDDSYQRREGAMKELIDLGLRQALWPMVEQAGLAAKDPEVAWRCRTVVWTIQKRTGVLRVATDRVTGIVVSTDFPERVPRSVLLGKHVSPALGSDHPRGFEPASGPEAEGYETYYRLVARRQGRQLWKVDLGFGFEPEEVQIVDGEVHVFPGDILYDLKTGERVVKPVSAPPLDLPRFGGAETHLFQH